MNRFTKLCLTSVLLGPAMLVAACGGESTSSGGADECDSLGTDRAVQLGLSGGSLGFYGYFAADALGYFEDEGIEVEITPTGGSSESAQLLSAGKFDIADGGSDAMLQAMAQGVKLYPFYNYWPHEFRTWVVPEESAAGEATDLQGMTVGVSSLQGGEVPLIRYILDGDVELVAVSEDPASVIAAFESDRIDAYGGNNATVIAMREQGFATRSVMPDEFSSGPVAPLLANEDIRECTDVLVKVGRAISQGKLYCLTSTDACIEVLREHSPELVEDEDLARATLESYKPITAPEMKDGKYFFGDANTVEGWELYLGIYSSGDEPLIADPDTIPLDELVIDDLDDEINDFDYEAVVEAAESH